ncbi:MAG: hypothetical protein F6K11_27500 [Leptolyngbya sp. SIO3F4]|nr:hypothetical protein [Leptolyngbya sp. SIO3F4]
MPWIHIISGEKGGVGKSIISLALPEVLRAKGSEFVICEADRSNGDVGAAFEGKHKVIYPYFVEDADQIDQADEVLEVALSGANVIVNTPAQSHRAIAKWFSFGSAELAIEEGVNICFWFVTSGEHDSVSLFMDSLKEFKGFPHVLIRNEHFTERIIRDYSNPDAWEPIAEAIKQHKVPLVNFPKLPPGDIDYIKTNYFTFQDVIEKKGGLTSGSVSRVRRTIKAFSKQVEQVFEHDHFKRTDNPVPEPSEGKKRTRSNKAKASDKQSGD